MDASAGTYAWTLSRLLHHLHDGHGAVLTSQRTPEAWLPVRWWWAGDELVVSADVKGIDGEVKRGDVVVAINGLPLAQRMAELSKRISSASAGHLRSTLVEMLHSIPLGDTGTLTVRRAEGPEVTVTISTDGPFVASNAADLPKTGAEIAPGVLYVDVSGLTDDALKPLLPAMRRAKGLVLDLRGYPDSGAFTLLKYLSPKAFESARFGVPVITRPERAGWTYNEDGRWNVDPEKPRLAMPVAWVTDGRAISYAESVLGIVEAYGLGDIVGETTAGTNGNINPFTVAGGYTIWWTGMRVLKHDGTRHHGVGIAPTVPVSPTREGIAAGRDELIEAAVATVQRKAAEAEAGKAPLKAEPPK